MNIKKTLQGWEQTLEQEASEGNEDARRILNWMKQQKWRKSQRQEKPRPFLQIKPKIEV